jgi:D-alanyl-lipoteichoic acid acyltransferase DltB (MBOAT superfamily)
MISGLWHGASWTFIIWGALHGVYQIVEILSTRIFPRLILPRILRWSVNFTLVTLAWIFFRAKNFAIAKQMLVNIFTMKKGALYIGNAAFMVYSIVLILFLFAADYNTERLNNRYSLIYSKNIVSRWVGYLSLILILLLIGVFNGGQFIYFQF